MYDRLNSMTVLSMEASHFGSHLVQANESMPFEQERNNDYNKKSDTTTTTRPLNPRVSQRSLTLHSS